MSLRLYDTERPTSGRSTGSAAATAWSARPSSAAGRATPARGSAGSSATTCPGRAADADDLRVDATSPPTDARWQQAVLPRRRADLGEELGDALPPHRRRAHRASRATTSPKVTGGLRLPHRQLACPPPQAAVAADRVHRLGRVRERVRSAHPPQRPGQRRRGSVAGRRRDDVPRHDVPDVRRPGRRVGAALVRLQVPRDGPHARCADGSSDGVGEFLAEDHHDGRSRSCAASAGRSTAPSGPPGTRRFSTDDGTTWETNWEMEETRVE